MNRIVIHDMDSLTSSKVGGLFAMIALTLVFGVAPYFLVARGAHSLVSSGSRHRVIGYFNCFGGGVFIGALLLHLMVEGAEEFEHYKELSGFDSDFPFFNLFVASGFFLVVLAEYFTHAVLMTRGDQRRQRHADRGDGGETGGLGESHGGYHGNDSTTVLGSAVLVDEEKERGGGGGGGGGGQSFAQLATGGDGGNGKGGEDDVLSGYGSIGTDPNARFTKDPAYERHQHRDGGVVVDGSGDVAGNDAQISFFCPTTTTAYVTGAITTAGNDDPRRHSRRNSFAANSAKSYDAGNNHEKNNNYSSTPSVAALDDYRSASVPELECSIVSEVSECVTLTKTGSPLRAFLLFMALSFHTLFDGLAVGLQTTVGSLWQMFAAIAVHKCIVGFCLGLELFAKYRRTPARAVLWLVLFSLVSPVGICVGISLTSGGVDQEARYLSSGVLQGVASGTFMYVTFFEILREAWSSSHSRALLDILFTLVGFASMAVVKYFDAD